MEPHRRERGERRWGRGGGGEEENGARDHELQRSRKRRDVDAGGAVEKVKPEQECERNAGNEEEEVGGRGILEGPETLQNPLIYYSPSEPLLCICTHSPNPHVFLIRPREHLIGCNSCLTEKAPFHSSLRPPSTPFTSSTQRLVLNLFGEGLA